MPASVEAGSYRAVLRLPHALRIFAPALGGRLAYGLLPLATLFTVRDTTGSFAAAGLALALFGLTSITLPLKARYPALLPWLAVACASFLACAAFVPWPVPFVGLAGLAAPPLGPAMRAAWRRLTEGSSLKQRAYALDAIAEETLYLTGPLLAGLLIAVAPARWALLVTALLLLAGTLGMTAASRAVVGPEPGGPAVESDISDLRARGVRALLRRTFDPGPLRIGELRRVLAVLLVAGVGISVAYTAMAATAQNAGRPGAAGLLEAGVGAGSVVGGLLWARRRHTRSRWWHLAGLLAIFAAGLLAAAAVPGLLLLGVVMSLAGVAVSPLFVVAYLAADDLTPPEHSTEAGTWVNVAANAGNAAGAGAAGLLTEVRGPATAFLAAGVVLALTGISVVRCSPNRR
ncbi:MFS transporter [Paractinoplanes ferrugineus]|uniref:MFS transporter n=1 Tax=Paractinoplanes ferrugineus TaxID=113564 RepID=A0A919J8B8_9ACTN|nr:MFS transporter [Actinoplanes ferrugineus]GIE15162.1 MFS transporter [Actinoplanes ferrugineus]